MIKFEPSQLQVYLVAGSNNVQPGEDLVAFVERALVAGVTMFQYREKGTGTHSAAEKLAIAQQLRELTQRYQVPFVIDDDLPLAIAIGADGIHVGQYDTAIQTVVQQAKQAGMFVGLSVSTPQQLSDSGDLTGVSYLGSGPVKPTTTKLDADPAIGTAGLVAIQQHTSLPIVAIGGINVADAVAIAETGVAGVAMISALTQTTATELVDRVAQIKQAFNGVIK